MRESIGDEGVITLESECGSGDVEVGRKEMLRIAGDSPGADEFGRRDVGTATGKGGDDCGEEWDESEEWSGEEFGHVVFRFERGLTRVRAKSLGKLVF